MTDYSKTLEKELQNLTTESKEKIVELQNRITDLEKNQAIYICKKYDRIDEGLGEFLNKYPEREQLKILFVRESEGVYQFGSRRVYVKIEKGNQIFVKVGGGFMHVNEFIEQFTPSEVEKIERKDVKERIRAKLSL